MPFSDTLTETLSSQGEKYINPGLQVVVYFSLNSAFQKFHSHVSFEVFSYCKFTLHLSSLHVLFSSRPDCISISFRTITEDQPHQPPHHHDISGTIDQENVSPFSVLFSSLFSRISITL